MSNKVNIFLSHKHEDTELAKKLKQILLRPNSATLDVYICEEIVSGTQWFKWIQDKLIHSNILILLFTGHTDKDWDWPLYEAGLFTDLNNNSSKKVICLNCLSTEVAEKYKESLKPLEHLQQYKTANRDDLVKFVRELYINKGEKGLSGSEDALAEGLQEDAEQRERLINDLSELLSQQPSEINCLGKRITLKVKSEFLGRNSIPDEALISCDGEAMATLFNRSWGIEHLWKALYISGSEKNNDWIQELWESLNGIYDGTIPSAPKRLYFPSHDPRKAYYAIPIQHQKYQNGYHAFTILFTEEPRWSGKSFTEAITSFKALMEKSSHLIKSTEPTEQIRIIAYTPALGFLSRSATEWDRLKEAFRNTKANISITCLDKELLSKWHSNFIGRQTERNIGKIDIKLAEMATQQSEKLLEETSNVQAKRVQWCNLPQYYIVSNNKWAIIVVPFFLPEQDDKYTEKERGGLPRVDMVGIMTNDTNILNMVNKVHDNYDKL